MRTCFCELVNGHCSPGLQDHKTQSLFHVLSPLPTPSVVTSSTTRIVQTPERVGVLEG